MVVTVILCNSDDKISKAGQSNKDVTVAKFVFAWLDTKYGEGICSSHHHHHVVQEYVYSCFDEAHAFPLFECFTL